MSWLLGIDRALRGQPDALLRYTLLGLAALLAVAAFCAPPLLKASVIAWVVLP